MTRKTILVMAIALFAASGSAFATALRSSSYAYPMPGKATDPAVLCTTCTKTSLNLPTMPYDGPLKRFVGRMLDSSRADDKQVPVRTLRARDGAICPKFNRLYLVFGGSKFAAWDLDSLIGSQLGKPLVQMTPSYQLTPELYLPWLSQVDADLDGWQTVYLDGQNRLGGFDFDDRGFVYLAYGPYGWGIVQDSPSSGLMFVDQTTAWGGVTPNDVEVLRSGNSYYAVIMNPTGASVSAVYDVTRPGYPGAPKQIERAPFAFDKIATATQDIFGTVSMVQKLEIFNTSEFVAGAPPVVTAEGTYWDITNDGVNFYAVRTKWPFVYIDEFSPSIPGDASSYALASTYAAGKGTAGDLRWSSGYLTLTAPDASNNYDVRLFKANGAPIAEVDLGHFFQKYYVAAPAGYAGPEANTHNPSTAFVYSKNGRDYLIYLGFGIADVFELQVPTAPLTFDRAADPNGDQELTVSDVFYLVNFIFSGGPQPVGTGDLNNDHSVTAADVFYAVSYLFGQK